MSFQTQISNDELSSASQLEKDLAHIINVTGKMRMLSHKVVMCALLHDVPNEPISFRDMLKNALSEFKHITQQITDPCPKVGICETTAAALIENDVVLAAQSKCLQQFIDRASKLQNNPNTADAAKLGDFASGELLTTLNLLIDNIRGVLDIQITHAQNAQAPLLLAASNSVSQINRLAKNLQIVAMNASLEAQRAGDHGAAFGEIAREMRSLSIKSLEQAARLDTDLTDFKQIQSIP